MHREFLAQNVSSKDICEAKDSVAESMARLFPTHRYHREDVYENGKLLTVAYTYEYSAGRAFVIRVKEILAKILPGLRGDPQST